MMYLQGSFVEYFYEPGGPRPYKCGYCKSQETSRLQGLMAYKMTCRDYQTLVDRGFQRSGKFVYRPVMNQTCCPQYVIRTDVRKFRTSKSQRGVVKKVNRYLLHGKEKDLLSGPPSDAATAEDTTTESKLTLTESMDEQPLSKKPSLKKRSVVRRGTGPDPTKPPCRKAKLIRRERRARKQAAKQLKMETETTVHGKTVPDCNQVTALPDQHTSSATIYPNPTACTESPAASTEPPPSESSKLSSTEPPPPESSKLSSTEPPPPPPESSKLFEQDLEETLAVPDAKSYAHRIETRLVPCITSSPKFRETYGESYTVFKKFQMVIHKEKEEDCQERHFEEFIVESPLILEDSCEGMPCGYGSYHQQYLLDGKIFAVGVLDILPKGVLCEYLYYDPDYRFIAPGVYTALQEICFTQQFYRHNPTMQYYYMGFYVQSCPKMNYKSRYSASYLLCPETYQYIPLERCVPKLLVSEYSRLADVDIPDVSDQFSGDDLNNLPVFTMEMKNMSYSTYRSTYGERNWGLIEEYVTLVGLEVALRAKLFLGRTLY